MLPLCSECSVRIRKLSAIFVATHCSQEEKQLPSKSIMNKTQAVFIKEYVFYFHTYRVSIKSHMWIQSMLKDYENVFGTERNCPQHDAAKNYFDRGFKLERFIICCFFSYFYV